MGVTDHATRLRNFVKESNRIEGIIRPPTAAEVREHEEFLKLPLVMVDHLVRFVKVVAPGKPLRAYEGMDVRVGNHIAPRGGSDIPARLDSLLDQIAAGLLTAWEAHRAYETLHPFMDGNGRSGRVLWLWQMLHQGRDPYALHRGFLHSFYYQTLGECRLPAETSANSPSEASAGNPARDEPLIPRRLHGRGSNTTCRMNPRILIITTALLMLSVGLGFMVLRHRLGMDPGPCVDVWNPEGCR